MAVQLSTISLEVLMRGPRLQFAFLVALLLPGCHLIFPFDLVRSKDAATDSGVGADGASDVSPDDAVWFDAPQFNDFDPSLDSPNPTTACSNGQPPAFTFNSTMVICGLITGSSGKQCDAAKQCNSTNGWHLCTATEYQNREDKTIVPSKGGWLASCVSNVSATKEPSNKICPACDTNPGPKSDFVWDCGGVLLHSLPWTYMSVRSWIACTRLGSNNAVNEAYWAVQGVMTTLSFVVCCTQQP